MRNQLILPRVERMRRVSRGAGVALLNQSDGYECYLDQATMVAGIIGDLGILKNIQTDPDSWDEDDCHVLIIPCKHMLEATRKLNAEGLAVALLDADNSIRGSMASYVCVALLKANGPLIEVAPVKAPVAVTLW